MNGHILRGTNIAVDYWKIKGIPESYIHFLTHVHGDHIVGLTSSWTKHIYCSDITAMLLVKRHGISNTLLKVLPIGEKVLINSKSGESFTVMAFDANHCPGAIMLHFQGIFGSIFYCGDFRNSADLIADCSPRAKYADILYLDNTFCDKKCIFPPRNESFAQILSIIRQHPEQKIIIAVRSLGKESMLGEIGAQINETIVVPPMVYNLCCELFDTNVFTTSTDIKKSRIWAVPMHINYDAIAKLRKIDEEVIIIIPTAIYTGIQNQPFSSLSGVFVVPYSDHSNYNELQEFVTAMKPKCIKPIVERPGYLLGKSLIHRADMSCFDDLLSSSSFNDHQNLSIEEERSALLINQLTNLNQESVGNNITEDCVSLKSKRAFKIADHCNNEESSTSHISETESRLKLNSFLSSMRNGKAKQRKESQRSHRKRIRSKSKGVVYIDSDETTVCNHLPSNSNDLYVNQLEVNHKKLTGPKFKVEIDSRKLADSVEEKHCNKAASDGQIIHKNKENIETSIIVIESDNDDDFNADVLDENMNVEKIVKKEDIFEKEKDRSFSFLDEEHTVCDVVQASEERENIIDIEAPCISTQERVSVPGTSSVDRESDVASVASQIHSFYKNNCNLQAEKPQISDDDVSCGLGLECSSIKQDVCDNFDGSEEYDYLQSVSEGIDHTVLRTDAISGTISYTADCRTNGHVLSGTDIAVDYWKDNNHSGYVHFLTNAHGDNRVGLTSSWERPIYCSKVTALLLEKCYHIANHQLNILPLCEKVTITSKTGSFTVMAFDANHCPGAIMLYFQGSFGSIFYTGNFRCSADVIADCSPCAKFADILYLDNTFCDQNCIFPPRSECLSQILDIIHQHPNHKVIIGVHKLGKENLLGELGTQLNETIVVPTMFYNLYNELFDTNVFTTQKNKKKSRICAVPMTISHQEVAKLRGVDKDVIIILPTAILAGLQNQPFSCLHHVYIVPYSEHSSYSELQQFVEAMMPKFVKPILEEPQSIYGESLSHRANMSCFDSLLSSPLYHDQHPSNEKGRSALPNQLIDCDQDSRMKSISEDFVSLHSKRARKNIHQDDSEKKSFSKTQKVSENSSGMNLNSVLNPLLIGKRNVQLEKVVTNQSSIKSKAKGVIYTEKDEIIVSDSSTSIGNGLPVNGTELVKSIRGGRNHLKLGTSEEFFSVSSLPSSSLSDENLSHKAAADKSDVQKNRKGSIIVIDDDENIEIENYIATGGNKNVSAEKMIETSDICEKEIDPDLSILTEKCARYEAVQMRELHEEILDHEAAQNSLLERVYKPGSCSSDGTSAHEHHLCTEHCDPKGAENSQTSNDGLPLDLHLGCVSGDQAVCLTFDKSTSSVFGDYNHIHGTSEDADHDALKREFDATHSTYSFTDGIKMADHVLPGTDIAIDYWKYEIQDKYVHFLTNLQPENIVGLTSSWKRAIYCSETTARILEKCYHISRDLLKILPLCEEVIITSKSGFFAVTAFYANHCPGAIMLHFQGRFGSIFYTGNFRCSTNLIANCSPCAKFADVLYIDNTFCDQMCIFPTRSECFAQILDIIRKHPKQKIIIGVDTFESEWMLDELGAQLNETIVVPQISYKCCNVPHNPGKMLRTPNKIGQSRIFALPVKLSCRRAVSFLTRMDKKAVFILPSAMLAMQTGPKSKSLLDLTNVYIVPYSNHPSYPELQEFVSAMRPKCVKPIAESFCDDLDHCLNHRTDMSCFDDFLSTPECFDEAQSLSNTLTLRVDNTQSSILPTDKLKGKFCESTVSATQFHSKKNYVKVKEEKSKNVPENILFLEKKNRKCRLRNNFREKIKSTHIVVVTGGKKVRPGTVKKDIEPKISMTHMRLRAGEKDFAKNECCKQIKTNISVVTKNERICPGLVNEEATGKKCRRKDFNAAEQCEQKSKEVSLKTANKKCSKKEAKSYVHGSSEILDHSSHRSFKASVKCGKIMKKRIPNVDSNNKSKTVCVKETHCSIIKYPEHSIVLPDCESDVVDISVSDKNEVSRQIKPSSFKQTFSLSSGSSKSNTSNDQQSSFINEREFDEQFQMSNQKRKTFVKSLQAFISKKRKLSESFTVGTA